MKLFAFIITVIVSIEADFVQTKHVALMSEPQVSTGHMTYCAPDYLLWAYRTPQKIAWEINGDVSNVSPQVQRLMRMIMAAIEGDGIGNDAMNRESRKLFKSVNIIMDETKHAAQRVELVEKNGDTTIIEFNNVIAK